MYKVIAKHQHEDFSWSKHVVAECFTKDTADLIHDAESQIALYLMRERMIVGYQIETIEECRRNAK